MEHACCWGSSTLAGEGGRRSDRDVLMQPQHTLAGKEQRLMLQMHAPQEQAAPRCRCLAWAGPPLPPPRLMAPSTSRTIICGGALDAAPLSSRGAAARALPNEESSEDCPDCRGVAVPPRGPEHRPPCAPTPPPPELFRLPARALPSSAAPASNTSVSLVCGARGRGAPQPRPPLQLPALPGSRLAGAGANSSCSSPSPAALPRLCALLARLLCTCGQGTASRTSACVQACSGMEHVCC